MKKIMLSTAILKSNKLFSAALVLIYTITMALLVMLCFFPESIDATFHLFLEEYRLPDAYIVTSGAPDSLAEAMEASQSVEAVDPSLVMDVFTELPSGKTVSLRYIGLRQDSLLGLYNVDTRQRVYVEPDTVAVSSGFARSKGLSVGSTLLLDNGTALTVTDIVSTPETVSVARNEASWYDTEDFAYIYVSSDCMARISGLPGAANQFRIYFTKNADKQASLEELTETEGLHAISSELFEGSAVDRQIQAAIDGTKAVVTYLPVFIVLIGLLFSMIFMSQIIKNAAQKITLLRTLGFSSLQVTGIFLRYSLLLTLVSTVLGGVLGIILLAQMLNIYRSVYDLPSVFYRGSTWMLLVVFAAVQLLGMAACFLSISGINNADPAKAIGHGTEPDEAALPPFIRKSLGDSFTKIALSSMYRNRKRLLLSTLCCIACLCLNHLAVSVLISKNVGLDSLFQDRIRYDVMAFCTTEDALDALKALPCVENAEKTISFSEEYDGEVMRFETLEESSVLTHVINTEYKTITPTQSGAAIEEGFARRHGIHTGDVISVNGVPLQVTDLSREYLYPVMYISPSQAEAFGYSGSNALAVSLKEGCTVEDFSASAVQVPGFQYLIDASSRERCVRETLSQLDLPCMVFLVFALVIGMVVVANKNILSIMERRREYATLLMLGTEKHRILKMTALEAAVQFLLCCVIGIPLAPVISRFMLVGMSSISQEYVPERPAAVAFIACILVLLYILLGVWVTMNYIRRMNLLHILAERE